jgi:hypothetical protein
MYKFDAHFAVKQPYGVFAFAGYIGEFLISYLVEVFKQIQIVVGLYREVDGWCVKAQL